MGSLILWSISTGSVAKNLATLEASWLDSSFEFILRTELDRKTTV